MFQKLLTSVADPLIFGLAQFNPVHRAAVSTIRGKLRDHSHPLHKYGTREQVEKIIQDLMKETVHIAASPNRIIMNREKLGDNIILLAKYQVLTLDLTNPPSHMLLSQPGISGELRHYIMKIVEKDEQLKQPVSELGITNDKDLHGCLIAWSLVAAFKIDVFDAIRRALGDFDPDPAKDWFVPFYLSMCTRQEYIYRKEMGLPDVLAQQDSFGALAGLKHGTSINIVLSGEQYPNLA